MLPDKMEDLSIAFGKYCDIMKQNTKGTQIGIYSVAIIGLSVALRRVRPFSKFKKPSDVPRAFILSRRELTGFVERIEPNGALLMVNHKPLIPLPGNNAERLPVKVANVSVTGHGISWLQAVVAGNDVNFIPVSKDRSALHCEILLEQKISKNKVKQINVGESLISVGFGAIELDNITNKLHTKYINKLRYAEDRALRREMGMKYYVKPTKLIIISVIKSINNMIQKTKKKQPNQKLLKLTV